MKFSTFIFTVLSVVGFATFAFAAPPTNFQKNLLPETTSTYELGTSTKTWLNLFVDRICLAADCRTGWPTGSGGGTGTVSTSTNESAGFLSYWTSNSATPALLGKVATGTLTGSGIVNVTNSPSIIGSNAVLSITGGTAGQILAWLGGIPTWTASTTFNSPLTYSAGAVSCASCITSAVTSLAANYPLSVSGSTGAVTISTVATSSLNLTVGSFLSSNISQWTNNSGYLTSLAGAASSTLLGDANTFTGANKFTNATTTALAVTNLTSGNCVQAGTGGNLINSPSGACGSGGGASIGEAWAITSGYLAPTTTLGIIVNASSTIGDGTGIGGLTINGNATTTGTHVFTNNPVFSAMSTKGVVFVRSDRTTGSQATSSLSVLNGITITGGSGAWVGGGGGNLAFNCRTASSILLGCLDTPDFIAFAAKADDPFTHPAYNGQTVSATSTGLWLTGSPLGLIASSTFATNATTTNATSTNLYATNLGLNSEYFSDLTGSGLSNVSGALTIGTGAITDAMLSSTFLKSYNPFTNPSATSFATTSGMVINNASSTFVGNLLVTGNATTTNATTTALAVSNLTSGNCVQVSTGGNLINSPNGACGSSAGLAAYNAFTNPTATSFASTSGMVINNASSTFVGNVLITGNATTSSATSTSFYTTNLGVNSEYFTDLTGTGLSNSGGALTVSGLTTTQFASANISQWTNNSGYFSSYDAWTHPAAGQSATTSVLLTQLLSGTSTIGALMATSSITNQSVKSALVLNSAAGLEGAYGGSAPCTNQVALSLSATGVITCTSVADAMLSSTFLKAVDPFTHQSYSGQTTSATTSTLWLTNTVVGLAASTSIITNATTTNATSTNFYTTNLGVNSEYFTDLTGSGLSNVSGALTIGTGAITDAMISSTFLKAYDAFPRQTTFNTAMSATTSQVFFSTGLFASSTSQFSNYNAINGTTTNATSTNLSLTNLWVNSEMFNDLTGAGLSNSAGALTIGTGAITDAMLSSTFLKVYDAFPRQTTYNTAMSATSSQVWFKGGIFASSTPNLPNLFDNIQAINATTTNATTTSLAITGAAENCNGTSALTTSSTGIVQCTVQPQGTVTAVSVVSANGFAGSSGGGATPALTITTTITGLLKGNGTAISAAALTDFPTQAANTFIANGTGATAAPTAIASTSIFTGTLGQVPYFQGTGNLIGTSSLFINTNSFIGIGTTTPRFPLQITAGNNQQLSLTSASSTASQWGFRVLSDGTLAIGTSSPSTFATTTTNVLLLDGSQASSTLSVGTTTSNGVLNLGSFKTNSTTTVYMGKIQYDGYDSAGVRICTYINSADAWVVTAGACAGL